jgi:hypothetical protein
MQSAFDLGVPMIEEEAKRRKIWRFVVVLPDEELQKTRVVWQKVVDFSSR